MSRPVNGGTAPNERPLVMFYTDASFLPRSRYAAFGVVGFCPWIEIPQGILADVELRYEEPWHEVIKIMGTSRICLYSGIVRNRSVLATEMMGVWACATLIASSGCTARCTPVIYCDNLDVVNACNEPDTGVLVEPVAARVRNFLDATGGKVKKVLGHSGAPGNEWADQIAKKRLSEIRHAS